MYYCIPAFFFFFTEGVSENVALLICAHTTIKKVCQIYHLCRFIFNFIYCMACAAQDLMARSLKVNDLTRVSFQFTSASYNCMLPIMLLSDRAMRIA